MSHADRSATGWWIAVRSCHCQPRARSRNFVIHEARWRSIDCPKMPIFFQTNKLRPSPPPPLQTNIVRLKKNADKWRRPLIEEYLSPSALHLVVSLKIWQGAYVAFVNLNANRLISKGPNWAHRSESVQSIQSDQSMPFFFRLSRAEQNFSQVHWRPRGHTLTMARQPSVGWACGWLVSAVFWSWVEKMLWFPWPFLKRKKMKCACTLGSRAPATFSESAELPCACPIFRHEKFAEPTRFVATQRHQR